MNDPKKPGTDNKAERAAAGVRPRLVSGIILAGGQSSRMGRDKAELTLGGRTLLQIQTEKLRAAGIEDVLISGRREGPEGTRCVPDRFPGRGPLAGLHACLEAANNPDCLVISVDVPLLPACVLEALLCAHQCGRNDATLLAVRGRTEPLIGVYRSGLSREIAAILEGERYAVRFLLDRIRCGEVPFQGEDAWLLNCNTPEDYETLCRLAGGR